MVVGCSITAHVLQAAYKIYEYGCLQDAPTGFCIARHVKNTRHPVPISSCKWVMSTDFTAVRAQGPIQQGQSTSCLVTCQSH